jgi:hypothetical protein
MAEESKRSGGWVGRGSETRAEVVMSVGELNFGPGNSQNGGAKVQAPEHAAVEVLSQLRLDKASNPAYSSGCEAAKTGPTRL